MRRILRADVPRETIALARALLTMRCVRVLDGARMGGRIVEVEAYPPNDPASHAYRGARPRCRSMFLGHWHAYVYFTYGMYHCLNVVSEAEGEGAGVLVRAIAPTEGVELMRARRPRASLRDLCRGPGRLTIALGIDRGLDGRDLDADAELALEPADDPPARIAVGARIGLSVAREARLRFFDPASPYVSGTRKTNLGGGAAASDAEEEPPS